MTIEDRCYDSRTEFSLLTRTKFTFFHKPRGWIIDLGYKKTTQEYTLEVIGVNFDEMDEAPPRLRAALARTSITKKMDGLKKTAKFGFLRRGEYIGASVLLNFHTKFAKLQVGKYVVSASQRKNPSDSLFPLAIALSGLYPL